MINSEVKKIFCIQGLSGTGKDTLTKEVSKMLNIPILVSHTTRPIRDNEVDGVEYHFVSDRFFLDQAENFLETREYHVYNGDTWYYGLHKYELIGKPYSFLIIDRQGYEELEEIYKDKLVSIFIYSDKETLINRLTKRGDNVKEIARRLDDDLKRFDGYYSDYIVYNDKEDSLEGAINDLAAIINSEMSDINE